MAGGTLTVPVLFVQAPPNVVRMASKLKLHLDVKETACAGDALADADITASDTVQTAEMVGVALIGDVFETDLQTESMAKLAARAQIQQRVATGRGFAVVGGHFVLLGGHHHLDAVFPAKETAVEAQ